MTESAINCTLASACKKFPKSNILNVKNAPNINGPFSLKTIPKCRGSKPIHFSKEKLKLKTSSGFSDIFLENLSAKYKLQIIIIIINNNNKSVTDCNPLR